MRMFLLLVGLACIFGGISFVPLSGRTLPEALAAVSVTGMVSFGCVILGAGFLFAAGYLWRAAREEPPVPAECPACGEILGEDSRCDACGAVVLPARFALDTAALVAAAAVLGGAGLVVASPFLGMGDAFRGAAAVSTAAGAGLVVLMGACSLLWERRSTFRAAAGLLAAGAAGAGMIYLLV